MRKQIICDVLALMFIVVCCNATELGSSLYVTLHNEMVGGFIIESLAQDYSLDYVIANHSYFPGSDYRQTVTNIETVPKGIINNDTIIFQWNGVKMGKYSFSVISDVTIKSDRKKVTGKVRFPITKIPDDLKQFLISSETIDSNNSQIITLANSLVQGENDLFFAVYNLAKWTKNNIEYNLSSTTASVSQPASWVIKSKKGVCDEITVLFIALCRGVVIPARFVSGIAYTTSDLFDDRWGPHGWAEVFFPGFGWLEYDVTYGQFGFLDASHIELKSGVDPNEPSTSYSWYGRNVGMKLDNTKIETMKKSAYGILDENMDIKVYPVKPDIGFNSYNVIALT